MKVYRIERKKYLNSTLTGTGAARTEGFRWNSLHTYLVYTSASRALAMLEVSVHLDLSEDLPTDRYCLEIEIPDELEILELHPDDLPDDWDAKPPILATQFIGDGFAKGNSAPLLKVPSAIVPLEYNYLINPNHPEALKIKVVSKVCLTFDKRWNQA
ncbi:MAG: RES family NAD+ phosphorylase [Leeuwenhoekiella sp.]